DAFLRLPPIGDVLNGDDRAAIAALQGYDTHFVSRLLFRRPEVLELAGCLASMKNRFQTLECSLRVVASSRDRTLDRLHVIRSHIDRRSRARSRELMPRAIRGDDLSIRIECGHAFFERIRDGRI